MSLARKIILFLGLLTCFFVCLGQYELPSRVYTRLAGIFVAGAVCTVFVEGTTIGTLQPISTRPVMIALGVLLMAASIVWLLALRGVLEK
jgi:hypothetical protein